MTLVDLLAGLEAEAAADAARLEADARAEADRIVDAARAEAQALREHAARAGESELQREAEQQRALARLAATAVVREAHEEAFRELLTEVRTRLGAVRDEPGYRSVLRALIREGVEALPAATTLRVDPRDELLAAELVGELEADLEVVAALETAGGVELEQGDGRAVRNTLEERLANAEPRLRLSFGEALVR